MTAARLKADELPVDQRRGLSRVETLQLCPVFGYILMVSIMIYFIQGALLSPVKIGYTKDEYTLDGRIESLQIAHPYKLRVLLLAEGDRGLEGAVHRRLAVSRLRGEWFKWSPPVSVFIDVARDMGVRQAYYLTKDAPWLEGAVT